MRFLFVFVLLLNVAYLAWEVSRPAEIDRRSARTTSSVPELVMLNEMATGGSDIGQVAIAEEKNSKTAEVGTIVEASDSPSGTSK